MTTHPTPRFTRNSDHGYDVDVDGLTTFTVWRRSDGRWTSDIVDSGNTTRRGAVESAVTVATSWPSTVTGTAGRPTVAAVDMVVGRAYRFTGDGDDGDGVVVVESMELAHTDLYVSGVWIYDSNVGFYVDGTTYPTPSGLGVFSPSDRVVDVTGTDDATLAAGMAAPDAWNARYGDGDPHVATWADVDALADATTAVAVEDVEDDDAEDDDAWSSFRVDIRVLSNGDVVAVDGFGAMYVVGHTDVAPWAVRRVLADVVVGDDTPRPVGAYGAAVEDDAEDDDAVVECGWIADPRRYGATFVDGVCHRRHGHSGTHVGETSRGAQGFHHAVTATVAARLAAAAVEDDAEDVDDGVVCESCGDVVRSTVVRGSDRRRLCVSCAAERHATRRRNV